MALKLRGGGKLSRSERKRKGVSEAGRQRRPGKVGEQKAETMRPGPRALGWTTGRRWASQAREPAGKKPEP